MAQLSTSVLYLLSHLLQPAVCCGGVVCARCRGGPASREAWSGHSTTSLEGTRAAMVPLSPSPIWPPHLSHPSISPSASCLPVCLLQPLTLQQSQASMAVAQRAERVPSGPQERLKRGGRWTERRTAADQMYFSRGQRLVKAEILSTSMQ